MWKSSLDQEGNDFPIHYPEDLDLLYFGKGKKISSNLALSTTIENNLEIDDFFIFLFYP